LKYAYAWVKDANNNISSGYQAQVTINGPTATGTPTGIANNIYYVSSISTSTNWIAARKYQHALHPDHCLRQPRKQGYCLFPRRIFMANRQPWRIIIILLIPARQTHQ